MKFLMYHLKFIFYQNPWSSLHSPVLMLVFKRNVHNKTGMDPHLSAHMRQNAPFKSRHPWGIHANLFSDVINGRWLNETTSAFRWSREQTETTQGTLTRLWKLWKQLASSPWNIWAGHFAAKNCMLWNIFAQIVFSVSPFKPCEWKLQKVI